MRSRLWRHPVRFEISLIAGVERLIRTPFLLPLSLNNFPYKKGWYPVVDGVYLNLTKSIPFRAKQNLLYPLLTLSEGKSGLTVEIVKVLCLYEIEARLLEARK